MTREYRDYVGDIVESIEKINRFSEGMRSFEDFRRDEKENDMI